MRLGKIVVCLLFALTLTFAQERSSQPVTVIRAGVLIDGKSDSARRDQVIVIRGNRIESVSDAASAKIPDGGKRH